MKTNFRCDVGAAVKRRTLDGLAVFCAVQRSRFDPAAWMRRGAADGRRVAFAAQYLSMTSWYGHEAELEVIAKNIYPDINNFGTFMQEMQAMDIELAPLSSSIRFGLPSAGSENRAAA